MMNLSDIMAARIARVDPPRSVPRVRVEVDSLSDSLVIAGHVLKVGLNSLEIYEDEQALFEREVEQDAKALELAQQDYERHEAEVREKGGETDRTFWPSISASYQLLFRRPMRALKSVRRLDEKPKKAS